MNKKVNIKDPYVNSKGLKKLWNYFLYLVEKPDFLEKIDGIRTKYNIDINNKLEDDGNLSNQDLFKDIIALAEEYELDSSTWLTSIAPLVLWNILAEPACTDICITSDNINDHDLSENERRHYPVSIRISPYASKRDILDYINRFYKYISQTQENYKDESVKIGRLKTRKDAIKKRNSFIYEHKHLPTKEIMQLVGKEFGLNSIIDCAYIGKIIALENKKRKEV